MITEEGVEFEDPKNAGSRMLLTPEKSIESQNDIGPGRFVLFCFSLGGVCVDCWGDVLVLFFGVC